MANRTKFWCVFVFIDFPNSFVGWLNYEVFLSSFLMIPDVD